MSANSTIKQLSTAKLWMVLVGVNHYQDSFIPNLKYCANDCKELAEALTLATKQFRETEIIALHDGGITPNLAEVTSSIKKFRLAQPKDTILFYFSGHGELDRDNRPVLGVTDTKVIKNEANNTLSFDSATGLKLDRLLEEFRNSPAQSQLIWLDACQAKAEVSGEQNNAKGQIIAALNQESQQTRPGKNFFAMLSCDQTERSWEFDELGHGLFTYSLIKGLQGNAANAERKIGVNSLFNYVKNNIADYLELKKHPITTEAANNSAKGLVIKPTKQVKRFPANVYQNPRKIDSSGEVDLIIGAVAPANSRKALICDRLSSSLIDIQLCKLLQDRGGFEVEYCFIEPKAQKNISEVIDRHLQDNDNETVLLYLSGSIEQRDNYYLAIDKESAIDLNWLGKQLRSSSVKEVIVIVDTVDTGDRLVEIREILNPDSSKSLCLIAASSTTPNSSLIQQIVEILTTAANSPKQLWAASLIAQLQNKADFPTELSLQKSGLYGSANAIDILLPRSRRSNNQNFDLDLNPYKSLQAFTQDDAYFFHGREALILEIIEKLQLASFLAVVGASGSGKSSVVKAGVIPKLLANGLNISQSQQTQSCKTWVMLPGDNPFAALARAISPNKPELIERVLQAGVKGFVDWLRQQPQAIYVLAIDQFEELFTLTSQEKERIDFIKLIIAAVEQVGDCFKVIITLRGDFLEECLAIDKIAPLVARFQVLVPSCRLQNQQYRQIIVKPAQKVGLEVENALVAVLLRELKQGSLPLLQYALEELWQKRSKGKLTLEVYQKHIGNLGKFLSNKAQETYESLSKLQQECTQSIFLSLVYLSKELDDSSKDTRRRIQISDLQVDKYRSVLKDTLHRLITARLIVVSGEGEEQLLESSKQHSLQNLSEDEFERNYLVTSASTEEDISDNYQENITVEVAHEILFHDWETLEEWLEENRDKYRLKKELKQKASEWRQNHQKEGFLLRKGALVKYEELYNSYFDELSRNSKRYVRESIKARDKTERQAKLRRRLTTGLLTGGISIISLVAIAAVWQLRQAANNKIEAQTSLSNAKYALNQRLDAIVEGTKGLQELNKLQKWRLAKESTQTQVAATLPDLVYGVRESNRFDGHENKIESVAYSPDGKLIATVSADRSVKLWLPSGKLVGTLQEHSHWVNGVAFSPEREQLVTVSSDNTVKLWQLKCKKKQDNVCLQIDGTPLKTMTQHTWWVTDVSFSPDGKTFVTSSRDGTVKIWSSEGNLLQDISIKNDSGENNEVWGVSFSPDGQTIATANQDGTVTLLNLKGIVLHTLKEHSDRVRDVNFSPDGKFIVSGSDDSTAILWQSDGTLVTRLEGHEATVNRLEFSSDSLTIATVSDGDAENVKLWNIDGTLLTTFQGHTARVKGVSFSPDGQTLATGSWDRTVRLWSLGGVMPQTLDDHASNRVMDVNFSSNGEYLVSASWLENKDSQEKQKNVILWKSDGTFLKTLQYDEGANVASFSPDGTLLVTGGSGKNNTVKIWRTDGTIIRTLTEHQDYIRDVSWSFDSQMFVTASGDNTAILWNRDGGKVASLVGHKEEVYGVSFSPDGKTIATSSKDKTVKFWNTEGELIKTLRKHTDWVWNVTFSPNGKLIASASEDGTVNLWDKDGRSIATLDEHTARVSDVTFSSDGRFIATGSADATVKLWTVDGRLLTTLEGHRDRVMSVSFHPDNNVLASSSIDGVVKLWNLKNRQFTTDIDILMMRSCNWVRDYLTNNTEVSEEDRKICDRHNSE